MAGNREAWHHDPFYYFYMTLSDSIFKCWRRGEKYSDCKCLEDNEGVSNRTTGFVRKESVSDQPVFSMDC